MVTVLFFDVILCIGNLWFFMIYSPSCSVSFSSFQIQELFRRIRNQVGICTLVVFRCSNDENRSFLQFFLQVLHRVFIQPPSVVTFSFVPQYSHVLKESFSALSIKLYTKPDLSVSTGPI